NARRWAMHPAYRRAFSTRFGAIRSTDEGGKESIERSEDGAMRFRVRNVDAAGGVEVQGGFYMGDNVRGGVNGRPYEIGIIDDPYKDASENDAGAGNPRVRRQAEEFYDSMFSSREQARSAQVIVTSR